MTMGGHTCASVVCLLIAGALAAPRTGTSSPPSRANVQQDTPPQSLPSLAQDKSNSYSVAIIGAGAGGSSAAFWLAKARERGAFGGNGSLGVDVDVYERANYVGGRSTIVYPYEDETLAPVELGASIFVPGNKDLQRAVTAFGLELTSFGIEDDVTGVWDGQTIVVEEGGAAGEDAFLARYGQETLEAASIPVQGVIDAVGSLYASTRPVWDTIGALAGKLGWADMLAQTGAEFFEAKNVSKLYVEEVIEGVARANYCQDVDKMHAIGAAIGLSTSGSASVAGGNRQMFEGFVKASGANLMLDTEVHSIERSVDSKGWIIASSAGVRQYDAVIFAAPFHQTGIVVPSDLASTIPPQPYKQVHVTLVSTTNRSLNATYLGAQNLSVVPGSLLISLDATNGPDGPPFNEALYLTTLNGTGKDGADEFIVKLFSDEELSDAFVNILFEDTVGWKLRHTWDAFPVLSPTRSFPPVRLAKGFFYVNALEPVLSTMETETIAARNVVDLLLAQEFGSSICPSGQASMANSTDFVYGWDC